MEYTYLAMRKDILLNIEQAMAEQRPHDKIVRILNNKFCIARSQFTDGSFQKEPSYFGLDNGKVYSYPKNLSSIAKMPNVKPILWCIEGNNSGLKRRWVFKTSDNRKFKQNCRKLQRLLNHER